jgi:hypothetical protein
MRLSTFSALRRDLEHWYPAEISLEGYQTPAEQVLRRVWYKFDLILLVFFTFKGTVAGTFKIYRDCSMIFLTCKDLHEIFTFKGTVARDFLPLFSF